jgi:deoxyadenosine/deoxycytidine kinase
MTTTKSLPCIVSIEGNIGSGKSTLLRYFSERQDIKEKCKFVFLQEPVDEWSTICDKQGITILEKFYGDQKKYAFSFQIMAYISRLAILKKAVDENPDAIIVTERSLYTDRYVFAKMLYDYGNIEEVDYLIYMKWFDTFIKEYPISRYVYVKTDPSVCHSRVNRRSRDGEDSISVDYLTSCHNYHEKMMVQQSKNNSVMEINGNNEFEQLKDEWCNAIVTWLEKGN